MTERSNIPFFFIVGRPRSGTTLLRTLFDANPHVAIPPESQFVVNLYPKYGSVTTWNQSLLMEFIQDVQKQWLFSTWKIAEEELKVALLPLTGDHSYGDICKEVYLKYNSIFSKDEILFFGDKNPGYTIYTELLSKIFPGAKFIHIIRDYRDHFVSVRNVDFELPMVSLVVFKWRLFVKHFRKMVEKYPDTHLEIKYEDLVTDPEQEMKRLCRFTGIPFDPQIFDFYKQADQDHEMAKSEVFKKFHSNLFKKIKPDKIGVYKKELTTKQIKMADAAAGKYAELVGYQRDYVSPGIWIRVQTFPGIVIAWKLRLLTKIVDHFPYTWRERILSRWPLMLAKMYLRIFNPKRLTGFSDL
ncbi:MAG: sulfotransferase [Bacteroidales bacterium]|nr:sulfotransferase [Bacteroidales bacterium]